MMKRLLTFFFFIPLLAGCSLLLSAPDVQVKDVGIVGLDSKGADVELFLEVTNPNSYALKLLGYSYDLRIMALPLTKGGGRETLEFPAGTTTDLRLPVRVTFSSFYELLKRRPDLDAVPYQLVAGLEVDFPLGTQTVPIDRKGTFKVPERYRPGIYLKHLGNILSGIVE